MGGVELGHWVENVRADSVAFHKLSIEIKRGVVGYRGFEECDISGIEGKGSTVDCIDDRFASRQAGEMNRESHGQSSRGGLTFKLSGLGRTAKVGS